MLAPKTPSPYTSAEVHQSAGGYHTMPLIQSPAGIISIPTNGYRGKRGRVPSTVNPTFPKVGIPTLVVPTAVPVLAAAFKQPGGPERFLNGLFRAMLLQSLRFYRTCLLICRSTQLLDLLGLLLMVYPTGFTLRLLQRMRFAGIKRKTIKT